MSYTFPNADSRFTGDFGAGDTKTYPVTIIQWVKYATHTAAVHYFSNFGNASDSINGSLAPRTVATDGAFSAHSINDSGGATGAERTYTTPANLEGIWFPIVSVFTSDTSRQVYVRERTETATSTVDRPVTQALRYLRVGGSLGTASLNTAYKTAEVLLWFGDFSALTDQQKDDILSGDYSFFGGRSDYHRWKLDSDSTSHADFSGNGGPTISSVGTVSYDADQPTITEPSTATLIPDVSPLYYGTTRLDNKTGIKWAFTAGQTTLTGNVLGSGVAGTTDASGNFTPDGPNDWDSSPVDTAGMLSLYWEEGSDPVVDRSLIVKTTLVEDT